MTALNPAARLSSPARRTAARPDAVDGLWVTVDGLWVAAAGRYTAVRGAAGPVILPRRPEAGHGAAGTVVTRLRTAQPGPEDPRDPPGTARPHPHRRDPAAG